MLRPREECATLIGLCLWRYVHPRLGLVDFGDREDFPEETGKPEWLGYDPSRAIVREQERKRRQKEIAELQELLGEGYRESIDRRPSKRDAPVVAQRRGWRLVVLAAISSAGAGPGGRGGRRPGG